MHFPYFFGYKSKEKYLPASIRSKLTCNLEKRSPQTHPRGRKAAEHTAFPNLLLRSRKVKAGLSL